MVKAIKVFWFGSIALLTTCLWVVAGPIPDTGQTSCYDSAGNVITCPQLGEAFYGQDGNYLINPPSYTKLDAAGNDLAISAAEWVMVRDNVTGLVWEVKQAGDGATNYSNPHDPDNIYTWYDSDPTTNGGNPGTSGDGTDTEDFIAALNIANFGSYNDWRLPTAAELRSIIDNGKSNPAINTAFFPNTQPSNYWSSTTSVNYPNSAWRVYFFGGGDDNYEKSSAYYMRAVRTANPPPAGRLIDNGDGTVTDTDTGLMWQQATAPDTYSWQAALAYCADLSLGGYNDWRLPTYKELAALGDLSRFNPAFKTTYFTDTQSSYYWSSTSYPGFEYIAFYIYFEDGYDYGSNITKSYDYYVRAVRAGQNQLSDHLIISSPVQASVWNVSSQMTITWDPQSIPGNVTISVSRDGGKNWEVIAASTSNDGNYVWMVTGIASANCMLKMEPLETDYQAKGNIQGLFTIAPCTNFTAAPLNTEIPQIVQFNNISCGSYSNVEWDFGDRNSSTDQNPIHTYHQAGQYTVKLSLVDDTFNRELSRDVYVFGNSFGLEISPQSNDPSVSYLHVQASPNFASDHTLYALSSLGTLYKSNNGGDSWDELILPDIALSVNWLDMKRFSLRLSPEFETDHEIYIGSTNDPRIFKTSDDGVNWNSLPVIDPTVTGVLSLAISPNFTSDSTLMAGIKKGGVDAPVLYKSIDGGSNWQGISDGVSHFMDIYSLWFSPDYVYDHIVYAANLRSNDGGESFNAMSLQAFVDFQSCVTISPNFANDKTLYMAIAGMGTEGWVYKSTDAGDEWSVLMSSPWPSPIHVSPDYAQDKTVYCRIRDIDNYTEESFIKTNNAGVSWTEIFPGELTGVEAIAIPENYPATKIVYLGTTSGIIRLIDYPKPIIKGDVDDNSVVNLADAVLTLRIIAGIDPVEINIDADINADWKIGMEELLFIFQDISNLR